MTDNRCMGCMKELDADASVCPYCGFDKDKYVSPAMTLPPGSVLANGKYLIGKTLGQGGFGVTYIALDQFLELRVVIKEYLPRNMAYRDENSASLHWRSMAEQKSGRENFIREARKMAQMDDIPGIVRVREVFYENSTAYIVMDYVEGETLTSRIQKNGAMDAKSCFKILKPVMDALEILHQRGIIHRNLNPDNIMLDERNYSWTLPNVGGEEEELDVGILPCHPFQPPEHYAIGASIGPWTDVYAMCATFHYCVSAQAPPPAVERIIKPSRLESLNSVPLAVRLTLERGLSPQPAKRIQTMAELRGQLQSAVNETKFLQGFSHYWRRH